jgi:hypothetical protein
MYCPECGEENEDNAKFCYVCGNQLIHLKNKEITEKSRSKFKLEAVLMGVISALILLYLTQGNVISTFLVPIVCSILAAVIFGGFENYGNINGMIIGMIAVFSAFFLNPDTSYFLYGLSVIGLTELLFILILFFICALVVGIPLGIIGGKIGIYLNGVLKVDQRIGR